MPQVRRETTATGGRYVMEAGGAEAELTFRRAGDIVTADHTFVPVAARGAGAGHALVERLVADARAEGFRIRPACSYVAAAARRHPEWAALFV